METLNAYIKLLNDYWQHLDYSTRWNIWFGIGLALLLMIFVIWANWFRKLVGYIRFRGTWYTPRQAQELVNILAEDQASGRRVMQHDEIQLLRQWQYGRDIGIGFENTRIH